MKNRQTLSLLVFIGILAMVTVMPTAFVLEMPGRVLEVNGPDMDTEIIAIDGATTYPSDTALYMTTVASSGGPSAGASTIEIVGGIINPRWQVLPVRYVYPQKITREEQEEHAVLQMEGSQSSAEVVALEKLGYTVTMTLTVSSVPEASPAFGKLKEGDILRSITNGVETGEGNSYTSFISVLNHTPAGTEVTVGFERDGVTQETVIVTGKNEGSEGEELEGSRLGVGLSIGDVASDVDVGFSLEDVGGPSAGTMFALGIYDELTQGSLGGKTAIAGTGTISLSGEVGKIGGIEHKMRGASDMGVKYFLAPTANCDDVVGNVPEGMYVYAISTFNDAVHAVEAIGRNQTGDLVTCEAFALKKSQ
ncbi:MAG: PDZ domain-containing protein [Actinomycetaceae bacterium]|nr:PDZ domain-containing protein [Actinomycetaceae bacterium]